MDGIVRLSAIDVRIAITDILINNDRMLAKSSLDRLFRICTNDEQSPTKMKNY